MINNSIVSSISILKSNTNKIQFFMRNNNSEKYISSKYSIIKKIKKDTYSIFNTKTGYCVILDMKANPEFSFLLNRRPVIKHQINRNAFSSLVEAGLIVGTESNELDELKEKRKNAFKQDFGLRLQIMPTLDCNFSCAYCFQDRSFPKDPISDITQENLIKWVDFKLSKHTKGPLIIKWCGGEALLELDLIRKLSYKLKTIALKNNAKYYSHIVTNGFHLNLLTKEILEELDIMNIQVTLDGPENIHDKRRKLKLNDGPTFRIILNNIKSVSSYFPGITIRINVDKTNYKFVPLLLDELYINEVFSNCNYYITSVHSGLGTCSADKCLTYNPQEWAKIESSLFDFALNLGISDKYTERFPSPCPIKCSAQLGNAYIVDPLGNLYKCITDASMVDKAIFNINTKKHLNSKRARILKDSGPFGKTVCEKCIYLPVCNGGCPSLVANGETPNDICTYYKYNLGKRLKGQILY